VRALRTVPLWGLLRLHAVLVGRARAVQAVAERKRWTRVGMARSGGANVRPAHTVWNRWWGLVTPGGAYRGAYILDAPASRDMVGASWVCPQPTARALRLRRWVEREARQWTGV